jgi:hypothetical protein
MATALGHFSLVCHRKLVSRVSQNRSKSATLLHSSYLFRYSSESLFLIGNIELKV